MRRARLIQYLLFALCLALFGAFLIWPIVLTLTRGFVDEAGHFTLSHVIGIFADPVLRNSLVNSTIIAVSVTLLSLLIGVPLAVLATRFEFRGKAIFSALLLVPLILPPFVGVIGLRQLLGRYGAMNSVLMEWGLIDVADPIDFLGGARLWGVIIMEALHLYPIIYLNVSASLANVDHSLEQAAENLGASGWMRFRRITLPLIVPGLFAGGTIVFIWAFTELGTPLMFDYYDVAPVQVFWKIQEIEGSAEPYALVFVMLLMSVVFYVTGKMAFGRRAYAMQTRAVAGSRSQRLSFGMGLLAATPFMVVTLLAILPHIGVVIASLSEPGQWYRSALPERWTTEHYGNALTHQLASGSIKNSLIYASLAMVLDIIFGILIAHLVVRAKIRGGKLLDGLAMLPLAVPGLVMAFGYVAMSVQIQGFFKNNFGMDAPNFLQVLGENPDPMLFLVIAYAVRRLPYVVRAAVAGLEQVPEEMEEAALMLGASRLHTTRRIVVPLIMANLIAGGLLAFSFAMLEVSDSLILAQTEVHFPITKAIYVLFERLGDGPYIASAMGVWGMALLTVTLVGASILMGKKLGAIFRI